MVRVHRGLGCNYLADRMAWAEARLTVLRRGRRHKDDNAHYNARKMRHHRPVQLEIFCKCSRSLCVFLRSLKEAAAQTIRRR